MSQKIFLNKNIEFEQGVNYEDFIAQVQKHTSDILCVIDNTSLYCFNDASLIPTNIKFDTEYSNKDVTKYIFYSVDEKIRYCVFNKKAFTLLNSSIKPVRQLLLFHPNKPTAEKKISIVDQGKKLQFINYNYPVEAIIYDRK